MNPAAKALQATQAQQVTESADADDKYKTDLTGQYVSKDVQVTGYEDGSERPTRPKYDILEYSQLQMSLASAECTECEIIPEPEDPCDGCGGGGTSYYSNFISSEDKGEYNGSFVGDIYALRIIRGDNSSIGPSEGHIKINVDLNKGAGGKYIYLTFTRDPQYSYENDGYYPATTYTVPLTHIKVESYTQIGYNNPFNNVAPGAYYRHMYRFNGTESSSVDLNEGAGGRYIFGHVSREATYGSPIQEVGVLYGNSSSIQPPSGWVKVDRDLNESACGDYIYFCYKK